jgi:type IV pilus assembly protein PilE
MRSKSRNRGRARGGQRGVTLIELMTVVVIVAILATIALPAYRQYLIRAQRSDATTALLTLQQAQEKFYLQNSAYAPDVATLGVPATSQHGLYTITTVPGPNGNQSFLATAAPISTQSQRDDTKCASLTLDDKGGRGTTGTSTAATCWG